MGPTDDSDESPTQEEMIERAIDWMEEQGLTLLPWQATVFRAVMLWDGENYVRYRRGPIVTEEMLEDQPDFLSLVRKGLRDGGIQ